MNEEYLRHLLWRLGSTSVGSSTARGMGSAGTIPAARKYLQLVDLRRFVVRSEEAFLSELSAATGELKRSLPSDARHWGSSRKFLNIFLRGCLYNRYLCSLHRLERIESWLEVPLDSHVAKGLKQEAGRDALPVWTTVIGLTPQNSDRFQAFASEVAKRDGVLRVHLDLKYWRRNV